MFEVKENMKSIEWSSTIVNIDKNSSLPMLVKPTKETARDYAISEEPILLDQYWIVQRIVAQNLEDEGAYVVGAQVDIPSEYTGTFKYLPDQKGNKTLTQTFATLKDVSYLMPPRVFCLKRTVVYPVIHAERPQIDDKMRSVVLQPNEQLNVIEKTEVYTVLHSSKFAFIGKNKWKYSLVPCLTVVVESSKEILNLPLSTRGLFSTLCNTPVRDRLYDFQSVLVGLDLPINLTTTRNCPKTLVDEAFLQPGMQLRLSAIEEHEVILGVTLDERIIEFSSDGVQFVLPSHLDDKSAGRGQEIAYQTAFQRFILQCQMKDSPISIRDYQKSIKRHVSRNVRLSKPKPLHMVAALRESKFSPRTVAPTELTAIACFSSIETTPLHRRSSAPSRRSMAPLPRTPDVGPNTPPLPPRNSRSFKSSGHFIDSAYPTRPPPPPPYEDDSVSTHPPPLPASLNLPFAIRSDTTESVSNRNYTDMVSSSESLSGQDFRRTSPYHDSSVASFTESNDSGIKIPSPPRHSPPTPEIKSHPDDSAFAAMESDDIFGNIGEFSISMRTDSEISQTKSSLDIPSRQSTAYENVCLNNQFLKGDPPFDSTLFTQPTGSASQTSLTSSAEALRPGVRCSSPEFTMSTAYDNRAYVASPILRDEVNDPDLTGDSSPLAASQPVNEAGMSTENRAVDLNLSIDADSISRQSFEQILANDDSRFSPEPSEKLNGNDASLDCLAIWESHTGIREHTEIGNAALDSLVINENHTGIHEDAEIDSTPLNSSVIGEDNTVIRDDAEITFEVPIAAAQDTSADKRHTFAEESHENDVSRRPKVGTAVYENVQLNPRCSLAALRDDSAHSFIEDAGENEGKYRDVSKFADSNNNEVASRDLSSPSEAGSSERGNILDDLVGLSSAAVTGERSMSPASMVSTKSSFVGSETGSRKNGDDDASCDNERKGFWVTQYSFGGDASFACNYSQAPENWMPPDDLSSLSVAGVANSLRFIGMNDETVEWFSAEKVDGQLLCALDSGELSKHFHLSPFQVKKLVMFLNGWRPKTS